MKPEDDLAVMKAGIDQLTATYVDVMVPLVADVNDALKSRDVDESIRHSIVVAIFDTLIAEIPR